MSTVLVLIGFIYNMATCLVAMLSDKKHFQCLKFNSIFLLRSEKGSNIAIQ